MQTFVVTLARALLRRGHDVVLYAADGSLAPGVVLRTVPSPPGVEAALWRADRPAARVPGLRQAFAEAFRLMRADRREVLSQHAFDSEPLELSFGGPVLHTLHLPPLPNPTT
ncbi:MAG: hypothetical protein ACREOV_00065, partial [Candidatus Dormibacteraceae bacterium]